MKPSSWAGARLAEFAMLRKMAEWSEEWLGRVSIE
jgi:hypothetical protein